MGISKFNDSEQEEIKQAIKAAEFMTSGEIRVFVESHCKEENVLDCAAYQFKRLEMHKTALRNGVLIYLAVDDHRFAIIGDSGINTRVPDHFWDEVKDEMQKLFREGYMTEGLKRGIAMTGKQLKELFPYQSDDRNELPDEIAY